MALLSDARRDGCFPVSFGILIGLESKLVIALAAYSTLIELALPFDFVRRIVESGFLLRLSTALLIDSRLLLQRIDGHQRCSGADVIA